MIFIGIIFNIFILFVYKNIYKQIINIIFITILLLTYLFNIQIISSILLYTFLLVINSDLFDNYNFLKNDIKVKLYTILLVIFLSFGHIIPISNGINDKGYSLGFSTPNELGIIVLSVILSLILFTYFVSHKYIYIFMIMISGLYIYYITNCRGLIFSIFIILFLFILHSIKHIRYIIIHFNILFIFLFIILSLIFVYRYNPTNNVWYVLNRLLSDRIYMQSLILKYYPPRLLGQQISEIVNANQFQIYFSWYDNLYIDNAYILLLLRYGILGFGILSLFLFIISFINVKLNKYLLSTLMIVITAYMFIESQFSLYLFSPIIYSFILLNKNKQGR